MALLRRLLRPRKHPRFYVRKGVFVVVGPQTSRGRKIQILDMSEGGCAFIYTGDREDLDETGFLSLVDEINHAHHLDRLDYVTKSDTSLPDQHEKSKYLRRRGVAFKWLGEINRQRLKAFIEENSIGHTE